MQPREWGFVNLITLPLPHPASLWLSFVWMQKSQVEMPPAPPEGTAISKDQREQNPCTPEGMSEVKIAKYFGSLFSCMMNSS